MTKKSLWMPLLLVLVVNFAVVAAQEPKSQPLIASLGFQVEQNYL